MRAITHGGSLARMMADPERKSARITPVSLVYPAKMAVRAVTGATVQVDAFEQLLLLSGVNHQDSLPARGGPLHAQDAERLLNELMQRPLSLGSFPPAMVVSQLLRELLDEGTISREELLRRVARFETVVVLRPDGYLAWALTGRTQQKVGSVESSASILHAGPFELGRFYAAAGGVFWNVDAQRQPIKQGPPLAEEYDDADVIGRALDGAGEASFELYHALGEGLTRPWDSLMSLRNLPAGISALIVSSPAYFERFRYMTRGEQIKALSKLTTNLIVIWGTSGASTCALTGALSGAEEMLPLLSLSAEGALTMQRVAVPAGQMATVLGGGAWAAVALQPVAGAASPSSGAAQGQMLPSAEEILRQSTQLPPETLSGFEIHGTKGLVGRTFQRNILSIQAKLRGATPLRQLIAAFEAEARAAGASRLSITGHAVINEGFFSSAAASRYGFVLRRINQNTIELIKELAP